MRSAILLLALSAAFAAFAQTGRPSVKLLVPDPEVYSGEPFEVQVEVEDFTECDVPEFPQIENCQVAGPDSSDSFEQYIVNNRVTTRRRRVYSFELTASKPGKLEIPPVKVNVDGKTLFAAKKILAVREGNSDEAFWAEITTGATRVYVGQEITLTLTLWIRAARADTQVLDAGTMFRCVERGEWGPFPLPDSAETHRKETSGGTVETFYSYTMRAPHVASRPGALALPAIEFTVRYPTKFSRGIFGELNVLRVRRIRAVARTPDTQVLPLPMAGRPESFNGAVGRFDIAVRAEPTNVRVGDPIKLTIELSGEGPVASLAPPLLASDPKLTESFRVPREELAGETRAGIKRFTQVIRAARSDVTEIPPIEYPHFDPQRGEYVVARSEPVPIRVAPGESLAAGDLESIPAPADAAQAAHQALDGLRGIETSESLLLARTSRLSEWQVLAVSFGPPLLFLAAWAQMSYAQARRADPAGRRRSGAMRRASSRIHASRGMPPAQAAHEVRAAIAAYLCDRLNLPPGRCDGPAGAGVLREKRVDAETIARWSELIERCELATFGGVTAQDVPELATLADDCLRRLERVKL